jgi:hypothetical protein
VIEEEFE